MTNTEIYPWLSGHWSFFRQRLEDDRLAHALLIAGPAGNGKTALAKAMVAKLLCNEDQPHACGQCRSCELLAGGAHPDFTGVTFEINPKTEKLRTVITVDQIREVIGKLQLTTSVSARKVTRIIPAEMMHPSAANALLKSLEEPVGDTVLVLVSDNPGRLPVTIRSRCQAISVHQPDTELVLNWLKDRTGKSDQLVSAALQAAGGSPLRAENYLDSPELDAYKQVREGLATLLERPGSVSLISSELNGLNPVDLWRWLSICTGDIIRSTMAERPLNWLPANIKLKDITLLQLQRRADINRQLSATQVRGDLLLQDWLIRWAEQNIGKSATYT